LDETYVIQKYKITVMSSLCSRPQPCVYLLCRRTWTSFQAHVAVIIYDRTWCDRWYCNVR